MLRKARLYVGVCPQDLFKVRNYRRAFKNRLLLQCRVVLPLAPVSYAQKLVALDGLPTPLFFTQGEESVSCSVTRR